MGSEILLSLAAGSGHGSRDVVVVLCMWVVCWFGLLSSQNIIDTSSNGVPLCVALNSY